MKHSLKITLFLLALFFFAQLIGLAVVYSYASMESGKVVWKDLPSIAGVQLERPDVAPQYSVLYIVGAVIIGTIFILLIARLRTMLLWKLWFTLAVVLCLQISLNAFRPAFIALALALIFGLWKVFRPNVYIHNFTELFIYGGLATIFVPILNVLFAFVLLLLLSIYDMYAVWRSKHMITMAKFQTRSGIFAGLLLPYKLTNLRDALKATKSSKPAARFKTGVKTAVLGGGDIGFPLIFSGTVLVSTGAADAIIVSVFAALSLLGLLLLSQKNKFYPAMPFLTIGCTVGYAIAFLL